jgi:Amt family ammonium transporter
MPGLAMAADEVAAPVLNSGDTAWMLTSTALVLFMTIPGLALFYGGMVRSKNILSVMMQCFAITGLISILWVIYGYSMAFDTTGMEARRRQLQLLRRRHGQGVPRRCHACQPDRPCGAVP